MARFFQEKAITPILSSADIVSGHDCDSILVAKATHVALMCMFGPSLSNNAVLTLYSGATDGTKTTAVTFAYTYGGAATGSASSDVLSTPATSAALTCTGTTFVSRLLLIEFDMENITDGHDWLTLEVSSDASNGELTVVAIADYNYGTPEEATLLS